MSKVQKKNVINNELITGNKEIKLDLKKGATYKEVNSYLNRENEFDSVEESSWTKQELFEEFTKVSRELEEAREQLQQKNAGLRVSQEAIGEVLVRAEIQARNIIFAAEENIRQISEAESKKQKEKMEELKEAYQKYLANFILTKELQEGADEVFKEIEKLIDDISLYSEK